MSELDTEPVFDRPPPVAWLLAWLFLVGQAALLMARGVNSSGGPWVVVSMLLSALLLRWVVAGLLRARTGRLVIVWVLLSAVVSLGFVGLAVDAVEMTSADLVTLAFALAQLAALGLFCTTDYFKHRRTGREVSPAALAPLLLIAVFTGLLSGLTAGPEGGATSTQVTGRF